jgi:hypothetical protein
MSSVGTKFVREKGMNVFTTSSFATNAMIEELKLVKYSSRFVSTKDHRKCTKSEHLNSIVLRKLRVLSNAKISKS